MVDLGVSKKLQIFFWRWFYRGRQHRAVNGLGHGPGNADRGKGKGKSEAGWLHGPGMPRSQKTMEHHHFSWENHNFLWENHMFFLWKIHGFLRENHNFY